MVVLSSSHFETSVVLGELTMGLSPIDLVFEAAAWSRASTNSDQCFRLYTSLTSGQRCNTPPVHLISRKPNVQFVVSQKVAYYGRYFSLSSCEGRCLTNEIPPVSPVLELSVPLTYSVNLIYPVLQLVRFLAAVLFHLPVINGSALGLTLAVSCFTFLTFINWLPADCFNFASPW